MNQSVRWATRCYSDALTGLSNYCLLLLSNGSLLKLPQQYLNLMDKMHLISDNLSSPSWCVMISNNTSDMEADFSKWGASWPRCINASVSCCSHKIVIFTMAIVTLLRQHLVEQLSEWSHTIPPGTWGRVMGGLLVLLIVCVTHYVISLPIHDNRTWGKRYDQIPLEDYLAIKRGSVHSIYSRHPHVALW